MLTKLLTLSEHIRDLTDENTFLQTENRRVKEVREKGQSKEEEPGLQDVIVNYQQKTRDLTEKVAELERKLQETGETEAAAEKSRYKPLARKLKEERNEFREQLEMLQEENKGLAADLGTSKNIVTILQNECKTIKSKIQQKTAVVESIDVEIQTDSIETIQEEEEEIKSPAEKVTEPKELKQFVDAATQHEETKQEEVEAKQEDVEADDNDDDSLGSDCGAGAPYSGTSSLSPEFQFSEDRWTASALLAEEEERDEALCSLAGALAGHQTRQQAVQSLQSRASLSWAAVSKAIRARIARH